VSGRDLESGRHSVGELGGGPMVSEHQLPKIAHGGVQSFGLMRCFPKFPTGVLVVMFGSVQDTEVGAGAQMGEGEVA